MFKIREGLEDAMFLLQFDFFLLFSAATLQGRNAREIQIVKSFLYYFRLVAVVHLKVTRNRLLSVTDF